MSGVRGWCPTAYRPMQSGDGLLVRVNPRLGWLSARQALSLCDLAERFGNGMIDLTSRANLQLRGVTEAGHRALLDGLIAEELVDASAEREARRALVIGSGRIVDEAIVKLTEALELGVDRYPALPPKVCVSVGQGAADALPGDFRFEIAPGGVTLRADGVACGRKVELASAVDALVEMMEWFIGSGGAESGRMRRHVARVSPPEDWLQVRAETVGRAVRPGAVSGGFIVGVPFGATNAADLRRMVEASEATHVGTTPWRLLRLAGVADIDVPGFLSTPDPVMEVSACPGAPLCSSGEVETREVARQMASRTKGSLHVSGCPKGCARQSAADMVLVGRNGQFDLVRNGLAGDTPERSGLRPEQVLQLVD